MSFPAWSPLALWEMGGGLGKEGLDLSIEPGILKVSWKGSAKSVAIPSQNRKLRRVIASAIPAALRNWKMKTI
jgi:hypothetical protein